MKSFCFFELLLSLARFCRKTDFGGVHNFVIINLTKKNVKAKVVYNTGLNKSATLIFFYTLPFSRYDFFFEKIIFHNCFVFWQENLSQPSPKPRSYSLSHDKAVPAVQTGTLQASSSETKLQELQQTMASMPVMRSIMSWLKSLRLHKYRWEIWEVYVVSQNSRF